MRNYLLLTAIFCCSIVSVFAQALSGTYTIDPSNAASASNFLTFSSFTNSLSANGVSGPVVVQVKEGVYNESVTIGAITGTSITNTVRFEPMASNTLPAELSFAASVSGDATLTLSGATNVSFDGLTFSAAGTTFGRIVLVQTGTGNVEFANSTFNGLTPTSSTSTNFSHVYGLSPATTSSGLSFVNNIFNNGSHVLYITGSSSNRNSKVSAVGNVLNNFTGYGMFCTYVDTLEALNNDFNHLASASTAYGIYSTNTITSPAVYANVQGNDIKFETTSTWYGIYLSYFNGSATMPNQIINNMVANGSTTSTTAARYGIYLLAPNNFEVFHNSVSVLDGSATSGRGIYLNGTTSASIPYTQGNVNFQNNIVSNTGSGYVIDVSTVATSYISNSNYNVYNGGGAIPFRVGTSTFTDLAAFQMGTSLEANSYFGDPVFAGPTDLHVLAAIANDVGNNTLGITTDIDGDTRPLAPSTTVDIGADEFAASSCVGPSALFVDGIGFASVQLNWSANSGETSWEIEVVPAGTAPTGAGTVVSTNPYIWNTGLSPTTDYDFYVKAICGSSGSSSFTGPFMFTTACGPILAPWLETFTGTSDPLCWSQSSTAGGPWVYTGNPGYTAAGTLDHTNGTLNNYVWMDHSGTDVGVILEARITDVSALVNPQLRFWMWSHYDGTLATYNETFIEAWDGTAWQIVGSVQGDFGPQWVEFDFVLGAYVYNTNLLRFRFRAESGGNNLDFYNDILIDDVRIVEAPTCPGISNATVLFADTTSGVLGWMSNGSETQWSLEYGPVGFTPGSGTSVLVNNNPDTIQGLIPNNFYDVYVRAICTPGDTSFYSSVVRLNTYGLGIFMETDNSCGDGFVDISGTGTNLFLPYFGEASVTMPFSFIYQDVLVTEATIGLNGGILFNTSTGQVSSSINASNPSSLGVWPFCMALDNEIGGVFTQVTGVTPNRKFIVQWNDVPDFPGSSTSNGGTFQVVFEEATQEIYFIYDDVEFDIPAVDFGGDAEIGVRGPNQNIDISTNSSTYLTENTCARFYYTNCPKPVNLIYQYITSDEVALSWNTNLTVPTGFTVIYGASGFDPATSGTSIVTTDSSVIIPGLVQLTSYDIYIYSNCSPTLESVALVGTFVTDPYCSNPQGFAATSGIDSISTTWTWVTTNPLLYPSTGFELMYGAIGFDTTSTAGTLVSLDNNFSDTTVDVTLLSGGVYDVYVRAVCGSFVSSFMPATITMPLTNDSPCGAEILAVDGSVYVMSNEDATTDLQEQLIAPLATGLQMTDGWADTTISFSTWFKFVAPASGNMRLDGIDVEFDGQFAVYSSTDCATYATFILEGANDDDRIDGLISPNFTICGLTPGDEYYLMFDSRSISETGIYSVKLTEIDLIAGANGGLENVCFGTDLDLFTTISGNDIDGVWVDSDVTNNLTTSIFSTSGLASGVYNFEYRLEDGCAVDSVLSAVEIYPIPNAGTGSTIDVCLNQPFDLLSGITGLFDFGGDWADQSGTVLMSSAIGAGILDLAGIYPYNYTVGNGVCPDEMSTVTVNVAGNCDFLSIPELIDQNIKIFPNPFQDAISIAFGDVNDEVIIELLDITGKVLSKQMTTVNQETISINTSKLADGVYFIRTEMNNQMYLDKVVKL